MVSIINPVIRNKVNSKLRNKLYLFNGPEEMKRFKGGKSNLITGQGTRPEVGNIWDLSGNFP